ncbi:MAG TPA: hypothetical protein VID04_17190 [Methylomirabilota bacterium]
MRDGGLIVIGPAGPDPLMIYSTLKPVGEHTFRVETKDGMGSRASWWSSRSTRRIESWEDR